MSGEFKYAVIEGLTGRLDIQCSLEITYEPVNTSLGFGFASLARSNAYDGILKMFPESSSQESYLSNLCRGRRGVDIKLFADTFTVTLYRCFLRSCGLGEIDFSFDYHIIEFFGEGLGGEIKEDKRMLLLEYCDYGI